ncbi:hypothetical protein B484DRAFT_456917 [Ochromonadaceae sp. CCMP2298]|nr:hypothetical protein B484DRAFT_456917 [Ochromonadaceae sp. CCMP2298]
MFAALRILQEQFTFNFLFLGSEPVVMKFDSYVGWLESKLLSVSEAELSDLDEMLDDLSSHLAVLKRLSIDCRASGVAANPTQVKLMQKLFDLIDSLVDPFTNGRMFHSTGKFVITSSLPDAEVIADMMANKAKLKNIDDIAASKKIDTIKFKGSKSVSKVDGKKAAEIAIIRAEAKAMFGLLEVLACEVGVRIKVLKYFEQVKVMVHVPLQALTMRISSLPKLADSSALLEVDFQVLQRADSAYTAARSAELLVDAASAQSDAALIEHHVEGMLGCLKGVRQEQWEKLLRIAAERAGRGEEAEEGRDWPQDLAKYLRASPADLLKQCQKESNIAIFCFSIIQMQNLLIALDREHEDAQGGRAVLADETWRAAVTFDTELFVAYAEDWKSRYGLYGSITKRAEFAKMFEKLCAAREVFEKARVRYDSAKFRFNGVVAQHREANALLAQLKERFCEVALSEVGEEVQFNA